jgi:uncharacterized DUF497 family protein
MLEFDPKKAASNLLKHGISFADAEPVLYDQKSYSTTKAVSGELRVITTGTDALGRVITIVWTRRGDNQRLISARHARKKEKAFYEA